MIPLEIVAAAIEGTGLKITPFRHDNPTPTVTLPTKGGTIMLATIVGDTLRSSISVNFTDGRHYDPGFRHAIRSVLAAEAANQCCHAMATPATRAALQTLVLRLIAPEEDAKIREALRCYPDDSLQSIAMQVDNNACALSECVAIQEKYVKAFPDLAGQIMPGDVVMDALLPLLKARIASGRPAKSKAASAKIQAAIALLNEAAEQA